MKNVKAASKRNKMTVKKVFAEYCGLRLYQIQNLLHGACLFRIPSDGEVFPKRRTTN